MKNHLSTHFARIAWTTALLTLGAGIAACSNNNPPNQQPGSAGTMDQGNTSMNNPSVSASSRPGDTSNTVGSPSNNNSGSTTGSNSGNTTSNIGSGAGAGGTSTGGSSTGSTSTGSGASGQ